MLALAAVGSPVANGARIQALSSHCAVGRTGSPWSWPCKAAAQVYRAMTVKWRKRKECGVRMVFWLAHRNKAPKERSHWRITGDSTGGSAWIRDRARPWWHPLRKPLDSIQPMAQLAAIAEEELAPGDHWHRPCLRPLLGRPVVHAILYHCLHLGGQQR